MSSYLEDPPRVVVPAATNRVRSKSRRSERGLDSVYKFLYNTGVTSEGSRSRIKWEGNSQAEIRSWPKDVRQDFGLELNRLDNHEDPLDSKSLGKGLHELRNEDKNFWYRLLYALHSGWIYVLHCFTKKTNKITDHDLKVASERLKKVKQRSDPPFEAPDVTGEKENA
jgi:phage-related protein